MTNIIRNNLLSLLNKNLYHVTIKMRLVDFKNINIERNDFIMKTTNNEFFIKSYYFEERYNTNIIIDNKLHNKVDNNIIEKTCYTNNAFILKKILFPNYYMSFDISKDKYFVNINTNYELPIDWITELNNKYNFNSMKIFSYGYNNYNYKNIINNLNDEDIIKIDEKIIKINDKYFNNFPSKF